MGRQPAVTPSDGRQPCQPPQLGKRAAEACPAAAAMLSAAASERGKRLSTKAQQGRSTASIDKLLPAGTVDLEKIPERRDFDEGAAGDTEFLVQKRYGCKYLYVTGRRRALRWSELWASGACTSRVRAVDLRAVFLS